MGVLGTERRRRRWRRRGARASAGAADESLAIQTCQTAGPAPWMPQQQDHAAQSASPAPCRDRSAPVRPSARPLVRPFARPPARPPSARPSRPAATKHSKGPFRRWPALGAAATGSRRSVRIPAPRRDRSAPVRPSARPPVRPSAGPPARFLQSAKSAWFSAPDTKFRAQPQGNLVSPCGESSKPRGRRA